MFYRFRQFITAAFAKLTKEDINFINKYLNSYEVELFKRLPKYCKVHSVRVARDALEESLKKNLYDTYLIKACLLHDIGKINCGFNMFTNSIIVIIEKLLPSLLQRRKNIKIVNAYYNHPEIALSYIENEDSYVKYLILNHHNYSLKEDEKLIILQRCDCKN
ncbi:HD domain-containing protein [Caloramator quimbayensis]|uniref:HD domain-containing protein n=1 Tax=Caloramator quimbayensis TaxID=1147123 RepID=A0A1T4YEK2_9CLOT|nr:HD domain-containing protein [Caloramator quimbayensis]SKB00133.1 HD domain-containing protein [Caloramator quimbayensis]